MFTLVQAVDLSGPAPESSVVGPGLPACGLFVAQNLDSRSQLLATEPTAHNPKLPGTTDFLLLPMAAPASLTSWPLFPSSLLFIWITSGVS